MLTISKPLSAGQAQAYHKEEFANAQGNYYSEGDRYAASGTANSPKSGACAVTCRRSTSHASRTANIRSRASNWCAIRPRGNT